MSRNCANCGFPIDDPTAPPGPAGAAFSVMHWRRAQALCDKARILLDAGRFAEAKPLLEQALAVGAETSLPAAWAGLAACLIEAGQFQEALAPAEKALSLSPSLAVVEAKAVALAELGRNDEAIPLFKEVLELDPRRPTALFYSGALLEKAGDAAAALREFDRALELKPSWTRVLPAKARCLQACGRHREALETYERFRAGPADDNAIYHRMAECADAIGESARAAEYLRLYLVKPPPGAAQNIEAAKARLAGLAQEADAFCAQAEGLLAGESTAEAAALFERAISLDPKQAGPRSWAGLAACRLKTGRPEEALSAADKALASSKTADALETKAVALMRLGRFAEAMPVLDDLLALQAEKPETHLYRGRAFEQMGWHDEALVSFDRALELMPSFVPALWAKGQLLDSQGRPAEALETYKRLAAGPMPDNRVYYRMALCAAQASDFAASAAYFQSFLKKPPADSERFVEDARRRLEQLESKAAGAASGLCAQAEELLKQRRFEEALAAADQALSASETAGALEIKAAALLELDRIAEAMVVLDELSNLEPGRASTVFYRGKLFEKQGDRGSALGYYQQALELIPGFAPAARAAAECLDALDRPREALAAYAAIAAAPMPDHGIYYAMALCAEKTRDFDRAGEFFRRFLDKPPAGAEEKMQRARDALKSLALRQRAASAENKGDVKELAAALGDLLALNPNDRDSLKRLAVCLVRAGKFEDAKRSFAALLKENPDDRDILETQGLALTEAALFDDALACLNRAMAAGVHSPAAWDAKFKCLTAKKDSKALAAFLEETLRSEPRNERALFMAASSAQDNGDRAAAALFKRFLAAIGPKTPSNMIDAANAALWSWENPSRCVDPRQAEAWRTTGEQMVMMGDFTGAESSFKKAVECNPTDARLWKSQGDMLSFMKRLEDALACYVRSCELNPFQPAPWMARAKILQELGRAAEALECRTRAKSLDPHSR